jgi:hypothetical protein
MEYFLGLIPSQNSFQNIKAIRDGLISNYNINDYRTNPIFHITLTYLKADHIEDLTDLFNTHDLYKLYFSKPILLNITQIEWWKNKKIAFTIDNTPIIGMIEELEKTTEGFNLNKKYRKEVQQYYSGADTEIIGDHLKLIRNVDQQIWTAIESSKILKTINNISFDKIAIFNADYSEYVVL